jgi:hypothetical protein
VAFIGAGFTAPIKMPTWKMLLTDLIAKVEQGNGAPPQFLQAIEYAKDCINKDQLVRAASVISSAAGQNRKEIEPYLKSAFSSAKYTGLEAGAAMRKQMEARLDALASLPWAGIVTSNYDTIVTDHFRNAGIGADNICYGPEGNLGSILKSIRRPFLVHLHGSVAAGKMVLTESDYGDAYLSGSQTPSFLRALFLKYTVVFIGSEVEDRFIELRRELDLIFPGRIAALPSEYVLLADSNRGRGEYLAATGAFKVFYYSNRANQHEGFLPALKDLVAAVREADWGTAQLDKINNGLLSVIQRYPKGIKMDDIVKKFCEANSELWENPDKFGFDNLNHRELIYRVFFLKDKKRIMYDPVRKTYRPANASLV